MACKSYLSYCFGISKSSSTTTFLPLSHLHCFWLAGWLTTRRNVALGQDTFLSTSLYLFHWILIKHPPAFNLPSLPLPTSTTSLLLVLLLLPLRLPTSASATFPALVSVIIHVPIPAQRREQPIAVGHYSFNLLYLYH